MYRNLFLKHLIVQRWRVWPVDDAVPLVEAIASGYRVAVKSIVSLLHTSHPMVALCCWKCAGRQPCAWLKFYHLWDKERMNNGEKHEVCHK